MSLVGVLIVANHLIVFLLIFIPYWYFSSGKNIKGKVAFTDKFNVYTYEFFSGRLKKLINYNPKIWYFSLTWSPTEPLIAIEYQNLNPNICHKIYVLNETDGKILLDLQYYGRDCHEPVWSPDGSMLASLISPVYSSSPEKPKLIIYQIKTGKSRIIDIPRLSPFYQKLNWLKDFSGGTSLYLAQLRENVIPTQYNLIKLDFPTCAFDAPYTLLTVKELSCTQNRISINDSQGLIAYGNSGLHYGLINEELKSFRFKEWWPVTDIAWTYDIFNKARVLFSTQHETD
ncbi:MAG: hypothetical protein GYA55_09235, partial [SAR324 cluster bacterium]|nr:hypothetical protein [SAR324 cluster bacterium]